MTSPFALDILSLAQQGLTELAQSQAKGRTAKSPASEAHYFSAWVTLAIKQKRFPHSSAAQLKAWQKQARTKGQGAALKQVFEQIVATYGPLFENPEKPVSMRQFEALAEQLDEAGWVVEPEQEIDGTFVHHTDGQGSLVLCARQQKEHFVDDDALVKPVSLYVRGDMRAFVQLAFDQGLLLHKVTDYKSKVKYHGEYLVYPGNRGTILAELIQPGQ
ncbi:DUF2913 family protein [Ferrimonas marina]|uniref:DUF2913 family protein n=1 Tax=Ferrimonas marina TaxID=299255 RepID=A0A1M5YD00_9GAMM|nr:DUF2913 family protein [Ferrimonas marina]SHI09403.1 Protein of unknown function [Ferrimonas marina]